MKRNVILSHELKHVIIAMTTTGYVMGIDMKIEVKGFKGEMTDVKSEIKDLKAGQARTEERLIRIESRTDSIENKLGNMEAQDANRHIEINGKFNDFSTGLAVVEAVTGKNMADIANIKLVK